jgi:hypothetical protein
MKQILILIQMIMLFSCTKENTPPPQTAEEMQAKYELDTFLYVRTNLKGNLHINYGYYHNWTGILHGPTLISHHGATSKNLRYEFNASPGLDQNITGSSTIVFIINKQGSDLVGAYDFNNWSYNYCITTIDRVPYRVDTTRRFIFNIRKVKDDPKYGHWGEGDFSCYLITRAGGEPQLLTGQFRSMMKPQ